MKKIFFTILLLVGSHGLFAQYLHYWDNSQPRRNVQPAENPKPVELPKPEEVVEPPVILNLVKIDPITLVTSIRVSFNTITVPPKIIRPPMIFHDWPDKCPGLSGAVPVLNNYVPAAIVLIVTEKYKGHLYSITTTKGVDSKPEYKLKVCKDGMIRYEFANYKGEIMADREE
jgi:hypothetical protein